MHKPTVSARVYVHRHACIWNMPQTNLHLCLHHSWNDMTSLSKTSIAWRELCLSLTLSATLGCSLQHSSAKFSNLSYYLTTGIFWILPPLTHTPPPCFPGHVSLVTPFKLSYSLQGPEVWHYNHLRCFSLPSMSAKMSVCCSVYTLSHTNTTNSPEGTTQQYTKRFGKGPFICASQHMSFTTSAHS